MPTSDDQQAQIAELRADFRVLQANFDTQRANFDTQQANFATHISETKHELTKYKSWIFGTGGGLALAFLVASVGTIFNLLQP